MIELSPDQHFDQAIGGNAFLPFRWSLAIRCIARGRRDVARSGERVLWHTP